MSPTQPHATTPPPSWAELQRETPTEKGSERPEPQLGDLLIIHGPWLLTTY